MFLLVVVCLFVEIGPFSGAHTAFNVWSFCLSCLSARISGMNNTLNRKKKSLGFKLLLSQASNNKFHQADGRRRVELSAVLFGVIGHRIFTEAATFKLKKI